MSTRIYPVDIGNVSTKEYNDLGKPGLNIFIGAVITGEFRCPQKGEWFVSGAVPQAYKAPNNLSTEYHIAKLVKYRKVIGYEIVE